MNKQQIINMLDLEPHVEGGYYTRTYQSPLQMTIDAGVKSESALHRSKDSSKRCLLTSIYYMLTDDSPIGYLHKNGSDIIHYYHAGSALKYILLSADGRLEEKYLGNNLEKGQQLQLVVRAGCWKATELLGGEYALISEAVSPGFDYRDMQIADEGLIKKLFNDKFDSVKKYIKS